MNLRRAIREQVLDLQTELDSTNERLRAEYAQQIAFNNTQKAMMDNGEIDQYEITEPERPKQVRIANVDKIVSQVMEFFTGVQNAHNEDPGIDGVIVEDYKTPQERAKEGSNNQPVTNTPAAARQRVQAQPGHQPIAGESAENMPQETSGNVTGPNTGEASTNRGGRRGGKE